MYNIVRSLFTYIAVFLLGCVIVKLPSWLRKSRRELQRLNARCLGHQLSFLDFSPATTDFRCIWPDATAASRKCRGRLNADDRYWANTLRNAIADDTPHHGRVQSMLREYAEFCLCTTHRPHAATSPAIIDDWVQIWLTEIQTLYASQFDEPRDNGDAVDESIRLYPLTTVPGPSGEDETQDVNPSPGETLFVRKLRNRSTLINDETTYRTPGSFPPDIMFDSLASTDVAGQSSPQRRRSSTPPSQKYSQMIRDSPIGIERVPFRKPSPTNKRGAGQNDTDSRSGPARFEPYPIDPRQTLLSVLNRPLGKNESKWGHVYIFTRRSVDHSHRHYVKIGVADDVPDRFEGWKALCRYEPHWEYQTMRIPNAMRVELLVHTELMELRRIERGCSGCGGDHCEWIEASVASARAVVERWAEWMQDSNPYTGEGRLSSHVVRKIFEHNWSKVPLTGLKMLALMPDEQAAVPAGSPPPPPLVLKNRRRRRAVTSINWWDPAGANDSNTNTREMMSLAALLKTIWSSLPALLSLIVKRLE